MNFSAFSIRNPVPAILLFAMLAVGGLLAFKHLSVQNFPDMDLPTIKITATLDGAAPAQLETEVARTIEDNLASLSYLDHVTTTITDGMVSISVSFKLEKDSETALNEVRNAVDSATADLPAQMQTPSVTKVTVQSSALVTYAIRSAVLNETELSWFIDNDLTKALLSVPGVGQVNRIGGVDREVHVDLDPTTMAAFGVTATTVSAQLKSVQADTSGGLGEIGGTRQTLRTLGAVASVDALKELRIPLANGQQVRLDDVASVTDSFAERSSMAYLDGKPVVAVEIKRSNGFSDSSVAADVDEAMKQFAAKHPNVQIEEAYSTLGPIIDNYDGSMRMLYEGAILAIIVVWLFLRDWRATILSAVALPLSVIPTFLVMYLAGFSLNVVTLLALSLVVGILVDDAIVEVENIARHLQMGKRPIDAALEAANEIGLAVIATTFTLVAVFLPTAFMSGIPGLIFRQFGITAAVAVLVSLVVARLLTPMMAAYFMKAHQSEEKDGRIMRAYLAIVKAAMNRRKTTVAVTAIVVALSLATIPLLKSGFLPASDDARAQITLTMQPGATIEQTDATTTKAADIIGKLQDVTHVFSSVGSASSGGGPDSSTTSSVGSATIVAVLSPIGERDRKQSEIENDIRQALSVLPGVRIAVGGGGNGTKLEITLASDDANALDSASTALEEQLRTLQGIGAVTSTAARQAPEIQITPDFARAAALGVTSSAIAEAVRVATDGEYSADLPKLNLPQRQVPIVVRFSPETRTKLDDIKNMRVAGTNGNVDLGSIADIRIGGSPSEIDRIDRMRNVTLSVELNGRILGDVNREAQALPALQHLPSGVTLVEQGELQRSSELFQSFGLAMAIGVFCIYAILVLLFHDFLQPFTLLMALPLSLGGALVPLVVTGTSFSMSAVIGLLMLMGVVTKNSILLIEYAIMSRRQGMPRFDALVDACHKRARPIIMTTIAMACGMLPVALSLTGGDSSFRQPMAIVVIGGVMMSTLLSLVVIPVIFTFVDDLNEALKRLVHRTGPDTTDAEPQASNDRAAIAFKPELSKRGQAQR
ncbi:efflux RND transporter permease subunit (plasmid) [Rhizobium leguminosarum bv. trifolii]|uniref:AcrB/AcrD/AcrF family protein n=1 Tax=Rhizobium ruizarguesonis TaxID=2081791 RepID=A0AAE8Q4J5_9HYPH|nr:efflux RND transporter permease subunit [Rhizobium ruizarguesonis]MBY5803801.1 efflux RND transporter permease subunit [Rhizobium leguminosarum]QIO48805.1 efflux RND transporter permease subunit [Rhizobium leguminosarum bv. trifolii]QJS31410.1 efflux RND transporter permease subunit [Rhizobium leguminosarum bv. trifolii TA1]TBY72730.1 efflux RND transporter permease subunit [Rhizobium leguminosarum bv. viciae]MBY5842790.1 efflux RND transporter permease subunit [Rhizobium leguminosarum]